MSAPRILAAAPPDIGINHSQFHAFGMTFNYDTMISTVVAGAIVVVFGLLMARNATAGVPTGAQLLWETVVGAVEDQVEESIGLKVAPFVVPLAVTLFFFIVIANWLELIPTDHLLRSPTADVNLTFALALFVIVWVHIFGMRQRGVGHYFKHFLEPNPVLLPINIIEEIAKPVSLALRLFGNVFAGGVMIAIIGILPTYALWLPNIIWKLFDAGIGVIQGLIFALLTILYFSFAAGGAEAAHASDSDEQHGSPAVQVAH